MVVEVVEVEVEVELEVVEVVEVIAVLKLPLLLAAPFTQAETLPPGCRGVSHAHTTVNASVIVALLLPLLTVECSKWLSDLSPSPSLRNIPE